MGFAESDREGQAFVAAFREGLQKLGGTEGRSDPDLHIVQPGTTCAELSWSEYNGRSNLPCPGIWPFPSVGRD